MSGQTMGERIRSARERKKLSQEAAAHQAGVALMTWNRWETGNIKGLHSDKLQRVADVLEVSETWLLRGEESRAGSAPKSPRPAGWLELEARRPELVAQFSEEERDEICAFAARYHRARGWSDFETVVLRILDSKPSAIFEEKRARKKTTE
jgi:transcriptional regulator with XRE-family HTH domain